MKRIPGFLLISFLLAAGAFIWSPSYAAAAAPVTSLSASRSSGPVGSSVTITSVTTDSDGNLTAHAIDYAPPGGSWISGSTGNGTRWDGSPTGSNRLNPSFTLNTAGTWQFRARGQDQTGQLSPFQYVNVTATVNDTTQPSVSIYSPSSGSSVSGSITVAATASDNVGVVGVQFRLDGGNLGGEDTSAPYSVVWNTNTSSNGSHTLTAVARDAAGNTRTSSGVTVTVSNDTTPPSVSITSPSSGATVSGSSVSVSATASDNVGVVGVQFRLDGANLGAEDTTAPYSTLWNTTSSSNGSHTLTAFARDAAGNTRTSTGIPVTVSNTVPDTTPPSATVTAPASGATVSGNSVTLSATASDNVGVAGVQFRLDGANIGTEDTTAPYSITWNSTTASNGSHNISAVARDAANNTGTSPSIPVTVSNVIVAGGSSNLTGWAWSETFGWISFNSADAGAGGGPYAVTIDSSGNFGGYAWSEYLGWISFNATDATSCSASPQARLNASTGAVTGWAYARAYGSTSDGCIELSGTNHASPTAGGTGGVTYSSATGQFSGYAWGGNTTRQTGPGWIQFDTANAVRCTSSNCGYVGSLTGTCAAVPPGSNQNIASGSSVTFEATPTSGQSPYDYSWNGGAWNAENPDHRVTITYSGNSSGPLVNMRDRNGLTSGNISCPPVTVAAPLDSTNLLIGRTAATANLNTFTVKQVDPFAIKWNFTLASSYSCNRTVTPNPGNSNWNANWLSSSGFNSSNNGDGTRTWQGDTGTTLTAGTVQNPVAPGIYQFGISCTSQNNPTQSLYVTLRVNASSQTEI